MKVSTFFKPLSFIPALLLMYMIYSFSAQPAADSSSTSYKVSREAVSAYSTVTGRGWEEWQIEEKAGSINPYIRKAAHVTEYFLLAVAVSFPLYVYGVRGILLTLLAGLICVGYACGDEYHQSFVAGRGPQMRDVWIDSMGAFAGVILVRLMGWSARVSVSGPRIERRQRRMQEELDRREEELELREERLRNQERQEGIRRNAVYRYEQDAGYSYGQDTGYPYGRDTGCPYGQDAAHVSGQNGGSIYERRGYGYGAPDDGYMEEHHPEYIDRPQNDYSVMEETEEETENSDQLSEDIPLFSRRKYRKK